MPAVSQIKSMVHLARGDKKSALRTQKIFIRQTVEPLLDNLPVVGQVKGVMHIMNGDRQRGIYIIKDSTTSTAVFIGAAIGGGPVALGFSFLAQGVVTLLDSLTRNRFTPFGVLEYISNFRGATFDDHVDVWTDIILTTSGAQFKNIGKLLKGQKVRTVFTSSTAKVKKHLFKL